MKSSLKSLYFIFSYIKKYLKSVIIVVILIGFGTYLQVIAPKLMGNAIDNMIGTKSTEVISGVTKQEVCLALDTKKTTITFKDGKCLTTHQDLGYVTAQIKYNKLTEIKKEMSSGNGLSKENEKLILNNILDTSKFKNSFKQLDKQQQKKLYDFLSLEGSIIAIDSTHNIEKKGWSKKQIKNINTSNINEKTKQIILHQDNSTILLVKNINELFSMTQDDVDKYHQEFLKTIIILLLSFIFIFLANSSYQVMMSIIAGKSTNDMRKGLFKKLEKLSIQYFDQSNDGDILSRFTNDIDNISTAMNQSFIQIITQISLLGGIVIMMFKEDNSTILIFRNTNFEFVLNNVLVWIMILFATIAFILSILIITKAKHYVGIQQTKLGDLNGYIDERISGQKIIITNGLEQQTINKFEEFNQEYLKTSILGQIYSGLLMPLVNGIGLINLATLVFIGAIFVAKGNMTVGLLVTFIQYSQRFFQPLAQMVSQFNLVELAISGGTRVQEVMDVKSTIINKENGKKINEINNKIELNNVSFGYYKEQLILKNIDIEVKKGQMVALVGPTGSGKSTIMNLMNRFYDIDKGEILFDGINICDIDLKSLRNNVGIVLQESIVFTGTIGYNISYGIDNINQEDIENAAKLANIHEYIISLKDGYETIIDNESSIMSVGQKQLLSIARTIITNPSLLILDEATSNVDTITEANIQRAMENVLKNRTSFVIAHRLKTILNADKIIVLKDGEIIEQGTHQYLLEINGFYAELYNNQFINN